MSQKSFSTVPFSCVIFALLSGVKCEECCRGTATSLCNKCETVYCSACFERVCTV